jgi:hypothetical protein
MYQRFKKTCIPLLSKKIASSLEKCFSTISQFLPCIDKFKKTYILTSFDSTPKTLFSFTNFKKSSSMVCQFIPCVGAFQKTYLFTFFHASPKTLLPSTNFNKPSLTLSTKCPSPNFQISIAAFSKTSLIPRHFGKNLSTINAYKKT